MTIKCIDYGAGNIKSIVNGFKKIGCVIQVVEDPEGLDDATGIVLPGVGNFGDAMKKLSEFKPVIKKSVDSGIPFLGVCLGIQIIFEESEESPGVEGLGLLEGTCKKFTGELKIPHMGWNDVKNVKETPLLSDVDDKSYYYFVHSYYVVPNSEDVIAGITEYDIKFPSIISQDNIYATQFHPEKSGDTGLKILKNFADLCRK